MVQQLLLKALMGIVMKLLASQALEDLLLWGMDSLANSTKTNVDNELVAVVRRYLGEKADAAADQPVG